MTKSELRKLVEQLEKDMRQAARELEFERAAELRDMMMELKAQL
jgi:excinuclease ABC subunit B